MSQVQTTPPSPRCAHCGDVIGVYEPAVVVEDGAARHTSLAAEPDRSPRANAGAWHHRTCFTGAAASAAAPAVA